MGVFTREGGFRDVPMYPGCCLDDPASLQTHRGLLYTCLFPGCPPYEANAEAFY